MIDESAPGIAGRPTPSTGPSARPAGSGGSSGRSGTGRADPFARLRRARLRVRTLLSRLAAWVLLRAVVRPRLDGRGRLPRGPAIYCFNHLSWADPFVLMAILPWRPRLVFFGPMEEDMAVGGRNRLMTWTGATIPYRPGKADLREATRRVHAAIADGAIVAIAGEGRIQPCESRLLPLNQGAAYFALREGVPLVPVAIGGTSWLGFGRRVRVRIGEPIHADGPVTSLAVDDLTARCWAALAALVGTQPETPRPGPFGRWLTELFNDWPEGSRAEANRASNDVEALIRLSRSTAESDRRDGSGAGSSR
jgi:1-acyl-sn-glycerol-3-phosphate acyltransferase